MALLYESMNIFLRVPAGREENHYIPGVPAFRSQEYYDFIFGKMRIHGWQYKFNLNEAVNEVEFVKDLYSDVDPTRIIGRQSVVLSYPNDPKWAMKVWDRFRLLVLEER